MKQEIKETYGAVMKKEIKETLYRQETLCRQELWQNYDVMIMIL